MNWFTNKAIESLSADQKRHYAVQDSCCEHVETDPAVAVMVLGEYDSFGPVATHVVCQACLEVCREEEDNALKTCTDCHQEFPKKELLEWKWYDFYPPQGDESLHICPTCRVAEKHKQRVNKDCRDREEERRYYSTDN